MLFEFSGRLAGLDRELQVAEGMMRLAVESEKEVPTQKDRQSRYTSEE